MTTAAAQEATDTPSGYTGASTRRVAADNAIEFAYRDTGDSAVPLVLLQHFRGNLDNWDPALIDALAAERRVITFDNVGVGATTGRTPNTVEAMAKITIYPDSAHGFLFQHHSRFAADVHEFLQEAN